MNAIRFARLAKAEAFEKEEDPRKSIILKRIWWCVLLRDRILSLGLRRPLQVRQDIPSKVLTADDFQYELGKSAVHDSETQKKVFMVISFACRLALTVTPALELLYSTESIEERSMNQAAASLLETAQDLQHCTKKVQDWHDRCSSAFPFPISLDDTPDAVCIFANMLFLYHDAAIIALASYNILLSEIFPSHAALFQQEASKEAIKKVMANTTERTTELVQVRLTKFLPISASAYLSLPLTLQAINRNAARGTFRERVESRKLDVFIKTLSVQQTSFEGPDFCSDLLHNIMSCAEEDERFEVDEAWLQAGSPFSAESVESTPTRRKLSWEEILYERPKLFLRVLYYLDMAHCMGCAPTESDFPPSLRYATEIVDRRQEGTLVML